MIYLNPNKIYSTEYPEFLVPTPANDYVPYKAGHVVIIKNSEIGLILGKIDPVEQTCYTDVEGVVSFADIRHAQFTDIYDTYLISDILKTAITSTYRNNMCDMIYDTLFGNFQHEQFDFNKATGQWVNAEKGEIEFEYNGVSYALKVEMK